MQSAGRSRVTEPDPDQLQDRVDAGVYTAAATLLQIVEAPVQDSMNNSSNALPLGHAVRDLVRYHTTFRGSVTRDLHGVDRPLPMSRPDDVPSVPTTAQPHHRRPEVGQPRRQAGRGVGDPAISPSVSSKSKTAAFGGVLWPVAVGMATTFSYRGASGPRSGRLIQRGS
jgi:hypothetical protein